jgi:hypothetical protein
VCLPAVVGRRTIRKFSLIFQGAGVGFAMVSLIKNEVILLIFNGFFNFEHLNLKNTLNLRNILNKLS